MKSESNFLITTMTQTHTNLKRQVKPANTIHYQLDVWPDFNQLTFSPAIVRLAAVLIREQMSYEEIVCQCEADPIEINLFLAYAVKKGLLR